MAASLAAIPTSATSISLSLSAISGSNSANNIQQVDGKYTDTITITTPRGGGLATGGHALVASTDSNRGYNLTMQSATSDNTMGSVIKPTTGTLTSPTTLSPNQWGVAIIGKTGFSSSSNYQSTNQSTLASTKYMAIPTTSTEIKNYSGAATNEATTLYYGVNADKDLTAGSYSGTVIYTIAANPIPPAQINTIKPAQFYLGSGNDGTVTITGTNMANAKQVFVDINGDGQLDQGEECRDLTQDKNSSGNNITNQYICTMPTDTYRQTLGLTTNASTGDTGYPVYTVTEDGVATKTDVTYAYKEPTTEQVGDSICENGNKDSDCIVDIDTNMIPIKYTGTNQTPEWKVVTNDEIANNPGSWYNYGIGGDQLSRDGGGSKWANAVTVKADKLQQYKDAMNGADKNVTVSNDDVLGYWVYIPRYAYEVMRPNAVDRVVQAGNFEIRFEKATDTKKAPADSCNLNIKTADQMWKGGKANSDQSNVLAKDYRTGCNISRTYGNATGTTWATHPAFTFGTDKLNGFWVGKYETTGSRTEPKIKPNSQANISETIGNQFTIAKSIGKNGSSIEGGNTIDGANLTNGTHSLNTAQTHMLKNSEWGAVAYLSASESNGAGVNKNQNNGYWTSSSSDRNVDADGQSTSGVGVTGCGPAGTASSPSDSSYDGGSKLYAAEADGPIESATACSTANIQRAYNGTIGQLASTSNNTYGIYDMSGGAYEYVMVNNTNKASSDVSNGLNINVQVKPPYVDLYNSFTSSNMPVWGKGYGTSIIYSYYYNDICTWATCGGHAMHETKTVQSVTSNDQSWGGVYSNFPSMRGWLQRGGYVLTGFDTGLFVSRDSTGGAISYISFRVSLLP